MEREKEDIQMEIKEGDMAGYMAIADVGGKIVRILKKILVPEIIQMPEAIGMCSPDEKGDIVLGVFLYDIQEHGEAQMRGAVDISPSRQAFPPIHLSLYYMITPYFAGNVKLRSEQEQRALGRIIQYFHDYPVFPGEDHLQIQLLRTSMEDKVKLWNFGSQPYRASLFYKVYPVRIDSARARTVGRVRAFRSNVSRREGA